MDGERARRLALNEAVVREVNEAVEQIAADWFESDEPVEFRCECADADCEERISILRAEYARVREDPARFVVAPGHEDLGLERIVRDLRVARVVEKIGPARDVAEETAPGG